VRFCSSTFFCARKNGTHFSLSGAKKRHIQPGTLGERKIRNNINYFKALHPCRAEERKPEKKDIFALEII
jgi:hypothetical protein